MSASTYDYYEAGRVPPVHVLLAMADMAEVELRWLITGQEPAGVALPSGHPVVKRAADLLAERPNAAPALAAFLDVLSQSMEFPAKAPDLSTEATDEPEQKGSAGGRDRPEADWIPILGQSAAGVPHFWSDDQAAEGVTKLEELIERHALGKQRHVRPAQANPDQGQQATAVQIIVLDEAVDGGPIEFVSCLDIKTKWNDAFAVRIDGESMAPSIAHGDLVILCPGESAVDGLPAVVQLSGQIGVTCKLYRRSGQDVHLVPLNEGFAPQSYPAGDVRWALRVLATIRPD